MWQKLSRWFRQLNQVSPELSQEVDHILECVGGLNNIVESEACTTRLRLTLKDTTLVNKNALMAAGAVGVVFLGQANVQIIYGLQANSYAQIIDQKRAKTHGV